MLLAEGVGLNLLKKRAPQFKYFRKGLVLKIIVFVSVLLGIGGCAGPYVLIEKIDPKIIETIAVYEDKSILENDGILFWG